MKGAYAETDYSIQGREVTYMGGEDVYAMQVVNGKASAPDTPVKSGYRFVGWYNGNAKWDFDTPVTENLTLTAKWEKIHTSAPSAPRYDVAVSDGAHGSVTVSPKSASKGSTVTVTVTPDKGYTLETLSVTDKNGSTLDLTDRGNGKYTFTMPSGPVTVAATFMDDNTMLNYFVDVPAGAYYYDAVLWATEGGIVTGTDAVHFSPAASARTTSSRASRSRRCSTASPRRREWTRRRVAWPRASLRISSPSRPMRSRRWTGLSTRVCSRATTIASCRRTTAPVPRS